MSIPHPNVAMLTAVYADLRCIERYADDDIVLHAAQRDVDPANATIRGKAAVVAKTHALLNQSGNTLDMRVESIVANDFFGAVLGSIHARRDGQTIGMPFCGVWRFHDSRIVEHWENAYDVAGFDAFLRGGAADLNPWVQP